MTLALVWWGWVLVVWALLLAGFFFGAFWAGGYR